MFVNGFTKDNFSKIGLILKKLLPNIIEAVILTGYGAGETVLIPCTLFIPTDYSF